jgi:hypothetical protein
VWVVNLIATDSCKIPNPLRKTRKKYLMCRHRRFLNPFISLRINPLPDELFFSHSLLNACFLFLSLIDHFPPPLKDQFAGS